MNHAVAESTLVEQLEVEANIVGKRLFPASDDDRREEHVALVDQPGPESVGGEIGAADREVVSR